MSTDYSRTEIGPLANSPVSLQQNFSGNREVSQQERSTANIEEDTDRDPTLQESTKNIKVATANKNIREQKVVKEYFDAYANEENLKGTQEKQLRFPKDQRAITTKDLAASMISIGSRSSSMGSVELKWNMNKSEANYSVIGLQNEEEIRNQLIIRDWLENLFQENNMLLDIDKLWDHVKTKLAEFIKYNTMGYDIEILENSKYVEFKIKSARSSILTVSIKQKENYVKGENPFLLTFLNSTQDSREDLFQSKQTANFEGNSKKNFPCTSIGQTEIKDDFSLKSSKHMSQLTPKQISEDKSSLTASLLVTVTEFAGGFDIGEKNFPKTINQQIDHFIDKLTLKKDWTGLKQIFRTEFVRMKDITSKKVKSFLNKLGKMVHNIDKIATDIMDKKVNIKFVELPMTVTAAEIACSETSVINFVRDITWAPLTYHKVDLFRDGDDSNIFTQTATQTILSMLAMIVGAVLYHIIKNTFFPPKDSKEIESNWTKAIKSLFIWIGSWLSIPGWNALQIIGHNTGRQIGLSVYDAGYFSSLFPGIPEGPIQGVMSIISANIVDHTWNKFRLNTFLQQLLIFATFGAVPGDIWQVAYKVITGPIDTYENLPDWAITLILGLGLATAVYICNVAFGTAYERLINESHLIIELEAVEESVDLKLDYLVEDHGSIVSYNGRPGAPSRSSIVLVKHDNKHSHNL